MVILFLTGCFSESINKRISRSLGIEIPKDIKIEYEDTHGGFHGDGETVAVVEFNNSIGEDIQKYYGQVQEWLAEPNEIVSKFTYVTMRRRWSEAILAALECTEKRSVLG